MNCRSSKGAIIGLGELNSRSNFRYTQRIWEGLVQETNMLTQTVSSRDAYTMSPAKHDFFCTSSDRPFGTPVLDSSLDCINCERVGHILSRVG